jgi:ribulose-phosphate 3-epimerase
MASIVPTVLAADPADYAERIARVEGFTKRLHIDICDGIFATPKTIGLSQVYTPDTIPFDLHLMMTHPESQIEAIASLQPQLVIIHFEADADRDTLVSELREFGIRVGLAINPETTVEQVAYLLPNFDHLLIFTGSLGHNGGEFRTDCLDKISQARAINAELEIAVDGGINQQTASQAIEAGANVLYAGSFIHDANDPEAAYIGLTAIAEAVA